MLACQRRYGAFSRLIYHDKGCPLIIAGPDNGRDCLVIHHSLATSLPDVGLQVRAAL